jgi:short-subunit dehydrogenase
VSRFEFEGRVALVTGAGGGIGRAVACSLAQRGCAVALADVDQAGMEETSRQIGNGARVTRHMIDVSDRDAVASLPNAIQSAHGRLDVLVNNAGVALGGSFAELSEAEFDWLMAINFEGLVRMTRAFLPMLGAGDQAQLVNVSSLFGLIAPPGQTAYAASKFAVRGFTQALRHELLMAKSDIGVTLVHPGGVKTAIAVNARTGLAVSKEREAEQQRRFAKALRMTPEAAGEIIVEGIERRAPRVIVGSDAKVVSVLERLMPVRYWRVMEWLVR